MRFRIYFHMHYNKRDKRFILLCKEDMAQLGPPTDLNLKVFKKETLFKLFVYKFGPVNMKVKQGHGGSTRRQYKMHIYLHIFVVCGDGKYLTLQANDIKKTLCAYFHYRITISPELMSRRD